MKRKKAKKVKKATKATKRDDSYLQKFVEAAYEVTQIMQATGVHLPSKDEIDSYSEGSQFEYVCTRVATQVQAIWTRACGIKVNSGDIALPVLMHLWKQGKVVYKFDSEFFAILANSASTQVHVSVLKRLPHTNFLLYVPHDRVIGYVVSISYSGDDRIWISCSRFDLDDDGEVCTRCCQAHMFEDNEEIGISMNGEKEVWIDESVKNSEVDSISAHNDTLRAVFMACYYLAASNAELVSYNGGKARGKYARKNGAPVSITEIQAGPNKIRYGKPFGRTATEKTDQKPDNANESAPKQRGPGSGPSPHMRRAHWHHYWTGPGREKLEVRWIEPVFVGGSESRSTVVHRVR
jgi:hypothetical protein